MEKKVVCVVQARMGSSRLPGKVLKTLCHKPLILHLTDRLKSCRRLDEIVVATTTSERDDPLCTLLESEGIAYYRGSETDVLERYVGAAEKYRADIVVRITGDCPLVHPPLIDDVIDLFLRRDYDYLSPRSDDGLIRGLDVEVFSRVALNKAHRLAVDADSREHVTLYMYKHPGEFNIASFPFDSRFKNEHVRLCVDEEADFKFVEQIYKRLYKQHEIIQIEDVLALLEREPELLEINRNVQQKKV